VIIRIARLRWAGHVARIDENCVPRTLMYVQPEGLRKVRRPRARWRNEVGKDAGIKELVGSSHGEEWRTLLKEAKTLYQL
jgi:hypothetical protein